MPATHPRAGETSEPWLVTNAASLLAVGCIYPSLGTLPPRTVVLMDHCVSESVMHLLDVGKRI
ncbi:hypothetical protein PYCCODRAFT_1434074 [Trametes coccinea BRFM310]|uniref:Uncharacterized protein n=1 Tax=Trametes coccinea (strain BRFM310) TaxID=1353009 RepID=A0A1Y2IUQ5_TRAC3|nr:hypothetical protein PYCCODRAFT_1434074 [Trametes coccinea BRFM310]